MRDPVFHRITDYDRRLLPNRHLAALDDGVTSREEWVKRSGLSIGYPGWGLLYYLTLCRLDPEGDNLVIETGTNVGSSTIILGQAVRDSPGTGVVRTVEIDEETYRKAVGNIEQAGVADLVQTYLGDSLEQLPKMLADGRTAQVAFLDGNHAHDHVVAEFEIVHPHLAAGAIVVMDNTYPIMSPGEDSRVFGGLHTIMARFGGHVVNLPYCSWYTPGIAIWQEEPFEGFNARSREPVPTMPPDVDPSGSRRP